MTPEQKLQELGIELKQITDAGKAMVSYVQTGNYIYISGNGPDWGGKQWDGKVGAEYTVEEGYEAARACGYNLLSVLKAAVGDLSRVKQVVKLLGMVNCTDGFRSQPDVIHGCSDLMREVFGEKGRHARSAVGVYGLPRNWPVEIEMIVEIEG